jgi:hypothetical protein
MFHFSSGVDSLWVRNFLEISLNYKKPIGSPNWEAEVEYAKKKRLK